MRGAPLLLAILLLFCVFAHAQQVTSWKNGPSDNWNTPARWTNGVPNNNGALTYQAIIAAAYPYYTIALDSAVTIDKLTVDTHYADLQVLSGGSLTLAAPTSLVELKQGKLSVYGNLQADALNITQGYFYWRQDGILGINNVTFAGTSANSAGAIQLPDGHQLTLPAATIVHGGEGAIGMSTSVLSGSLRNEGTISADVSGQTLTIQPKTFTNVGTLEAKNSGILTIDKAAWSNAGVIRVDNGTLNLGGSFPYSSLAGLQRTGGTINITGTMDAGADTIDLSPVGMVNVVGGSTIIGGRIVSGGTSVLFKRNSTYYERLTALDGTIYEGDLTNEAAIMFKNGAGFTGSTLNMRNGLLRFDQDGVLNDKVINLLSGGGTDYPVLAAGPGYKLTLGPTTRVEAARGTIGWEGSYTGGSVENQGLMRIAGAVTVNPLDFVNKGTIEVLSGANLLLCPDTSWSNSGVFHADNAQVTLQGQYDLGSLLSIQRTGGTLRVQGTVLTNGGSLHWDDLGPGATLSGTIVGGHLYAPASGPFPSTYYCTLDGTILHGDLDFRANNGGFRLKNGAEITGSTIQLNAACINLTFDQDQVLNDKNISLICPDRSSDPAYLVVTPGHTLTIGPTTTIDGNGQFGDYEANGTVWNYGTVSNVKIVCEFHNAGRIEGIQNTLQLDTDMFTNEPGGTVNCRVQAFYGLTNLGTMNTTQFSSAGNGLTNSGIWNVTTQGVINNLLTQTSGITHLVGGAIVTAGRARYPDVPATFAGGELCGNGTIDSITSIFQAAQISPGDSIGTIAFIGKLQLAPETLLALELSTPGVVGGTANDLITVQGDLDLAGTVNVACLSGFGNGTYRLITYTGILNNAGLSVLGLPSWYQGQLDTSVPGQVNLIITPEPTSLVLLPLGLVLLKRRK